MKIRNGFVSNSSSSSFLVVGFEPKNIKKLILEKFKNTEISETWYMKICCGNNEEVKIYFGSQYNG